MAKATNKARRTLIAPIFAPILALGLAASCSGEAPSNATAQPPAMLRITEQPWTGWSEAQPMASVATHPASPGTEITLGRGKDAIKLKIDRAVGAAVTFTVPKVAKVNPTGGTNLGSCGEQRYALRVGEKVRFATCTMDEGTTWTVERQS